MRYLRYALLGLVVCIGAVVIASFIGPLIAIFALPVAIIISVGALCSFLWKLVTGRSVTRSRGLPDIDLPRNTKNEPDIDFKVHVDDATEFIKRRLSSVWSGVEEDLARLSLLI